MNKWKLLFFILLSVNLIFLTLIFYVIYKPQQNIEKLHSVNFNNEQKLQFLVQTNKYTLNNYINEYINKNSSKPPYTYRVLLEDDVKLSGHMEIFTNKVEYLLTFDPQVTRDGNLLLRQKQISLGRLELPAPFVLSYIEKYYQLPDWVSIYPNEKTIHLKITDLTFAQKYKLIMKEFNLKKNEIVFNLSTVE
ncbi:YpmS family protein [Bacillus sp. Marseille-P3661]|uniref:YpmS family protein n=1 Tax=Bacillus sp. Marseille-P3661 TaxID=1936234 RepID=UPI0015E1B2C1|nr:YpmS family protein [Bacillus sp. Marseille-P3661]